MDRRVRRGSPSFRNWYTSFFIISLYQAKVFSPSPIPHSTPFETVILAFSAAGQFIEKSAGVLRIGSKRDSGRRGTPARLFSRHAITFFLATSVHPTGCKSLSYPRGPFWGVCLLVPSSRPSSHGFPRPSYLIPNQVLNKGNIKAPPDSAQLHLCRALSTFAC